MDRKTVTVNRACEIVGVTRSTMYSWMKEGKVEYIRTASKLVRIFEDSLWRDRNGNRMEVGHG